MTSSPTTAPVTAVIVGAGHRGLRYASYAEQHPTELAITAVVDPDPVRRGRSAERFVIPAAHQFSSVEELVSRQPGVADAAINATMDSLHLPTSVPLLDHGYDVLLEKPIGTSADEVLDLHARAERNRRTVMICHVLRYAPFYAELKRVVASGRIGTIINLQLAEDVSFHHLAAAFIRGKWNDAANGGSSMLLAKCCHDLDLMTWFKSGVPPTRVTSFGNLMYFRPEHAPEGAGTRCLVDCEIEPTCPYSARKHYVDQDLWSFYAWPGGQWPDPDAATDDKLASLRHDNPLGRCVWHCDNTVVDHQSVAVEFGDGATGTLNMAGNAAKTSRTVKIIGTDGEIDGALEDGQFTVRTFDADGGAPHYAEDVVRVDVSGDMHGGGDLRLVGDFVSVLTSGQPSISTTTLDDSINGHLLGFAADRSVAEHRWVDLTSEARQPSM